MLPCVVFLHGNTSSRLEALPFLRFLLPSNICVFCFDFSGSGLSDGEYVSLGWWEKEDLKTVITFLRSTGRVGKIALIGRSMGAVTALMYASEDPSISGIVVDSPFSNLAKLIKEIGSLLLPNMPSFMVSMLLWFIKKSVKNKANFNIDNLSPIDLIGKIKVPALFIVGNSDTLVQPIHGITLYSLYTGKKSLLQIPGDHNSDRPIYVLSRIYNFVCGVLEVDKMLRYKVVLPDENKSEYVPFPQIVFPVTRVIKLKNIVNNDSKQIEGSIKSDSTSSSVEED